jgi:hypothetical protein
MRDFLQRYQRRYHRENVRSLAQSRAVFVHHFSV